MSDPSSTPPPLSTSTTAMNGDKLSGQLIIKAQLGDDIRKMMIHNEDLTLNGKYSHSLFLPTIDFSSSSSRTRSNDGTCLRWKDLQFG